MIEKAKHERMARPDKNDFKFHEAFVVGAGKYAGQVNDKKNKNLGFWWVKRGMGLPAHQMLLLNSSKIQLGMPFLRRSHQSTWEGSIMEATLSKNLNSRDFRLAKTLENPQEYYLTGEEFYTGVSLAKSSKSKLS